MEVLHTKGRHIHEVVLEPNHVEEIDLPIKVPVSRTHTLQTMTLKPRYQLWAVWAIDRSRR